MPKPVKVTIPDGSALDQHLRARPGCQPATEVLMLANTMATLLQLGGGLGIQGILAMQNVGSANDGKSPRTEAGQNRPQGTHSQPIDSVESPVVASFMDAALNFTSQHKE